MANKAIAQLQKDAESLYNLRKEIEEKEEAHKKELEVLKEQRDAAQALIISQMNKLGIMSMKVSSGDTFAKAVRKGLEVTSESLAFKWAYENRAVSINKTVVAQLLKDSPETPPGFERVEKEYISVRKAAVKKTDE